MLAQGLIRAWAGLRRAAGEFCYPRHCVWCRSPLAASALVTPGASQERFCVDCRGEFLLDAGTAQCSRCAAPLGPYAELEGGCRHCRGERFAFDAVCTVGQYDGLLQQICLRGKRSGAEALLTAAAELAWEHWQTRLTGGGLELVIPVSQFWVQRWTRDCNPPELLGSVWSRRLGIPLERLVLKKVRSTQRQGTLPASERRQNQRGAFSVADRAGKLRGRHVLLVDDVLTTGATADAASRALKKAGAERVVVAVLARAVGRR